MAMMIQLEIFSTDPAEIEKTSRVLPIGFWKGAGLSIALDLVATILSVGNSRVISTRRENLEKGIL